MVVNGQDARRRAARRPVCRGRDIPFAIVSVDDTIEGVSKHDRALRAIFADPVRASIKWNDIESLLRHLGADVSEGAGSRVRIALNDVRAVFHRPHPRKETDKGAVKSVRRFLTEAGVNP